jgi:general stress protein 26
MNRSTTRNGHIRRLGKMIENFQVAMLTTVDGGGALHSRPMATQYAPFDGHLWFFTRAHTHKVAEVQSHRQVNVSYADPQAERYISISGTAELVRDRRKLKELWNPIYTAWFPQGLADTDLALLKVHIEQAEYWDPRSGVMVEIAGFIRTLGTDELDESREQRKVRRQPA